jgi:hypothetical protein
VRHRGSGHRLAQWEGCYSWSTIRGRLSNAIFNWEVSAPPIVAIPVCAARDDTRFMVFLPSSVQTLNTWNNRGGNKKMCVFLKRILTLHHVLA